MFNKLKVFFLTLIAIFVFVPQRAKTLNASTTLDETNVYVDLRNLYGNDYDFNNFYPENYEQSFSFKFLCAKPYQEDLYMYFYFNIDDVSQYNFVDFYISKSKTQFEDGSFEEDEECYSAKYLNSYGALNRKFHKFKIENIVIEEIERFYFARVSFQKFYPQQAINEFINFKIEDELYFSKVDNEYQYLNDTWINITDKKVAMLLIGKDLNSSTSKYYRFNEETYCFFDTNYQIDELLQVDYAFENVNYEMEMKTGVLSNFALKNQLPCYDGKLTEKAANIQTQNITRVVYPESYLVESEFQFIFKFWKLRTKYQLNKIVDLKKVDEIENEKLKSFFLENGKKEDGTMYQYAFHVYSTLRQTIGYGTYFNWWFKLKSLSNCNEVKQVLILKLKFRTNQQEFDLHALDKPSDTENVKVVNPEMIKLDYIIMNGVKSGINSIKKGFSTFKKIFIAVAGILILYPILKIVMFIVRRFRKWIQKRKKARNK